MSSGSNNFIRLYCIDAMDDTIFAKDRRILLEQQGIIFTGSSKQADIVISRYASNFATFRRSVMRLIKNRKLQFLIWTDEPRYNTCLSHKISGTWLIPDVHVMNCYTADIYISNYYHCWPVKQRLLELNNKPPLLKNRTIVMLAKFISDQNSARLMIKDRNVDLSWLRCHIALEGHKQGLVDIYGKNWPNGIEREDSRRQADWYNRKMEILGNYRFNLCFENTIYPYYCTEKIWHSIAAGCLPIYYGEGTGIYEDFPADSFIDYSQYENTSELFDKIQSINEEEFRHRMHLCIQTYNRIFDADLWRKTINIVRMNTVNRLRKIRAQTHCE
jgi:alpha(1,3/1,4) fucosyltransferase